MTPHTTNVGESKIGGYGSKGDVGRRMRMKERKEGETVHDRSVAPTTRSGEDDLMMGWKKCEGVARGEERKMNFKIH